MSSEENLLMQVKILWMGFILAVVLYMILITFPFLIFLIFNISPNEYDINNFNGVFAEGLSKFGNILIGAFFIISLFLLVLIQKIKPKNVFFTDAMGNKVNNNSKYVLTFALSESIAIMGLFLFLAIGSKYGLYVFGTLSLISLFLCYPKK